ncbi:MAG TPA: hypothetical protein VGK85_00205, partial [Myxococcaceae bacterium]
MLRVAAGMVLALGLAGCATTGQQGTGGSNLFGCEQIPFSEPVPKPTDPQNWHPEKGERGYVHVLFFVAGGQVYAIGVPVVGPAKGAERPFFVGPMKNLDAAFPPPPSAAAKELQQYPDWHAFYRELFRAYGDSRPLALVCPGPDCPITPESPPPGVLGATASFSTTALGPGATLERSLGTIRFAALDAQAPAKTATDATLTALAT